MTCAWKEFLCLLPPRLREEADRLGKTDGQNLRLRLGSVPELVCGGGSRYLSGVVTREDLHYCVNAASRYSPWSAATAARGYITAPGGHRLGLCGEAVVQMGQATGIRECTSLCIRIARDFPGISRELWKLEGSTLILGAPGWGKTTLLRDLIRQKARGGANISVVDQRQELFPLGLPRESRVDVLSGCPREQGIDWVLRCMEPGYIALDEITAREDCEALLGAAWCGVGLLATAHAGDVNQLKQRPVYRELLRQEIFDNFVCLRPDKTWHLERSGGWCTNGSVRY